MNPYRVSKGNNWYEERDWPLTRVILSKNIKLVSRKLVKGYFSNGLETLVSFSN